MKNLIVMLLLIVAGIALAGCGSGSNGFPAAAPESLTAYSLAGVTASINETAGTVDVTLPYGTDVTALVATFTLSGGSLVIDDTIQVSGETENDFSSPVTCKVIAPGGTTTTYTVTVVVAASTAKAITAFSLDGIAGSIYEDYKTIVVKVPYTVDLTTLVATFTTTGANVKVGDAVQVSGFTVNDFSALELVYTVTAADTTTVDYNVYVIALSPFVLTAPLSVVAGAPFSILVEARTSAGTERAYTGTVHFTSTDTQAVLPADARFQPGDYGYRSFSGIVLKTAGTQSVTVSDTDPAFSYRTTTVDITVEP